MQAFMVVKERLLARLHVHISLHTGHDLATSRRALWSYSMTQAQLASSNEEHLLLPSHAQVVPPPLTHPTKIFPSL